MTLRPLPVLPSSSSQKSNLRADTKHAACRLGDSHGPVSYSADLCLGSTHYEWLQLRHRLPLRHVEQFALRDSSGQIWGETFTIDPGNLTNRGAVSGKTYYEGAECGCFDDQPARWI